MTRSATPEILDKYRYALLLTVPARFTTLEGGKVLDKESLAVTLFEDLNMKDEYFRNYRAMPNWGSELLGWLKVDDELREWIEDTRLHRIHQDGQEAYLVTEVIFMNSRLGQHLIKKRKWQ